MKQVLVYITAITLLVAADQAFCQKEVTGSRIKLLVQQIDSSIAMYEAQTKGFDVQRQSLQKDIEQAYRKLKKDTDRLQQEADMSDLLTLQARLHVLEWNFLSQTKDLLTDILPGLNHLSDEVDRTARSGFQSQEEFTRYHERLSNFLGTSTGVLRDLLPEVTDPAQKRALRDAALSLSAASFAARNAGPTQAKAGQLRETIRQVENAVAMLQNVGFALLSEKAELQAAGYRGMVRLILARLGDGGKLNVRDLSGFVTSNLEQIGTRRNLIRDAADRVEGPDAMQGDDPSSAEIQSLLNDINR